MWLHCHWFRAHISRHTLRLNAALHQSGAIAKNVSRETFLAMAPGTTPY
jgi:hypothetical protein